LSREWSQSEFKAGQGNRASAMALSHEWSQSDSKAAQGNRASATAGKESAFHAVREVHAGAGFVQVWA